MEILALLQACVGDEVEGVLEDDVALDRIMRRRRGIGDVFRPAIGLDRLVPGAEHAPDVRGHVLGVARRRRNLRLDFGGV